MIKKLSILLVIAGSLLLVAGVYQYFHAKSLQKASLAEAYKLIANPTKALKPNALENKYVYTEPVPANPNGTFNPLEGDITGILAIPALAVELPIVEGTDKDELAKGVGHFKGSAYPSQNDQIVLSGHRDTVFRRLGELKIGDEFIIKMPYGEFTYIIEGSQIVDENDTSIIKSTAPQEVLIVSTCYPFSFVGDAPYRYVLTALPAAQKK